MVFGIVSEPLTDNEITVSKAGRLAQPERRKYLNEGGVPGWPEQT